MSIKISFSMNFSDKEIVRLTRVWADSQSEEVAAVAHEIADRLEAATPYEPEENVEKHPRVVSLVSRVKYLEGGLRNIQLNANERLVKDMCQDLLYKYGSDHGEG